MIRIIVAYGFMGSKRASRVVCIVSKLLGDDTLLLLGDTISPHIIEWLFNTCSMKIYGVLGRLDNPAVSRALVARDALIECKLVSLGGLKIYGYGYTRCEPKSIIPGVDILATSIGGIHHTCCREESDIVDNIVSNANPKIVITGSCIKPCRRGFVASPGSVLHGYIGIVKESNGSIEFNVVDINYYIYETS